jgi:caa(3)-type oxidase subunit IV
MERDDIIEYSEAVQHTDAEGKVIRKKLWKVFWILLIVTIVEVAMGIELAGIEKYALFLKVSFILFTIVKAGYIVMIFMHLGDEMKFLRWVVLVPYISFILYLLFICIQESNLMFSMAKIFGT